jgi:hypothetical protein
VEGKWRGDDGVKGGVAVLRCCGHAVLQSKIKRSRLEAERIK